jgi:hypothetical protein
MALVSYKVEMDTEKVYVSVFLDESMVKEGEKKFAQFEMPFIEGEGINRSRKETLHAVIDKLIKDYNVQEKDIVCLPLR